MTGWSTSAAPRFDVRWDTPFEESKARLRDNEQVIPLDICREMARLGFDANCARIPPDHPVLGNLILRQKGFIAVFFEERVFLDDKKSENEKSKEYSEERVILDDKKSENEKQKGYMAVKTARFNPRPEGGVDIELL